MEERIPSLSRIPNNSAGLRLCKITKGELVMCETVLFAKGRTAVEVSLRRAAVCGSVGELGETGDYWADLTNDDGDLVETISLNRGAWNSLKNRWARCRIEPTP